MMSRVTIYFESEGLRKSLEAYSKKHRKSFSETVIELAGAGFSLFQKIGSLNVDLLIEKVNRLDEAKKEIDFLRGIIKGTVQMNKLLAIEKAPLEKSDSPPKTEGGTQETTPKETSGLRRVTRAPAVVPEEREAQGSQKTVRKLKD